jgi:hypothetical protein
VPKPSVDVDALHEYLWQRADARGQLILNQYELAGKLELPYVRFHRIIDDMRAQGRLVKLKRIRSQWQYRVIAPERWRSGDVGDTAPVDEPSTVPASRGPRRVLWG